jgi:hypothetical protein
MKRASPLPARAATRTAISCVSRETQSSHGRRRSGGARRLTCAKRRAFRPAPRRGVGTHHQISGITPRSPRKITQVSTGPSGPPHAPPLRAVSTCVLGARAMAALPRHTLSRQQTLGRPGSYPDRAPRRGGDRQPRDHPHPPWTPLASGQSFNQPSYPGLGPCMPETCMKPAFLSPR